ncbi:MAG: ABC transporter permease, partial [Planctomycetota bacterium]
MQNSRYPQPFMMQIWDLFLIELTNWRWTWQYLVVVGTITPLLSMVAFSIFARDSGPEALEFIWSGNVVIGLMFGLQSRLTSHFVYLRLEGMLNY